MVLVSFRLHCKTKIRFLGLPQKKGLGFGYRYKIPVFVAVVHDCHR